MRFLYHVTSSLNRESIIERGLDWPWTSLAPGIAGSRRPEQQGCFLAEHEQEADWFVQMNNTGGPVDVWEVQGAEAAALMESPEGYCFYPGLIAPEQLRLVRRGLRRSLPDG